MEKVKCIKCDRKHTCKPKLLNEIKLLECYVYPITVKRRIVKPKIDKTLIVKVDKVEFNVMD